MLTFRTMFRISEFFHGIMYYGVHTFYNTSRSRGCGHVVLLQDKKSCTWSIEYIVKNTSRR